MGLKLDIQKVSQSSTLPDETLLNQWALQALDDKNKKTEILLRIVDEQESRELNKAWRNKDAATNVLSFPVGEIIEQVPELLGDVVICAPIVEREAREQGKTSESHWAHLIIHGILHLQGYDHEQERNAKIMEAKEISILKNIGYSNPYEMEKIDG